MKAAVFNSPKHPTPPARRPHCEHPTAGTQTHQKRQNRAAGAGSVLPSRPNVLPIPARDGGGGIWVNRPTLQTFFFAPRLKLSCAGLARKKKFVTSGD